MSIEFTQYMRPNGRKVPQWIDRPKEVETKAAAVIAAGGRFEMEELMTGIVSLTVAYEDDDIAHELCENGPPVPSAVDALVEDAYQTLVVKGASTS